MIQKFKKVLISYSGLGRRKWSLTPIKKRYLTCFFKSIMDRILKPCIHICLLVWSSSVAYYLLKSPPSSTSTQTYISVHAVFSYTSTVQGIGSCSLATSCCNYCDRNTLVCLLWNNGPSRFPPILYLDTLCGHLYLFWGYQMSRKTIKTVLLAVRLPSPWHTQTAAL